MKPVIKVCCIASLAEARLAVATGADALGLVSAMPSGPGVIDDTTIAAIAAAVPRPTRTFLLTARTTAESIAEQHARAGTTTLQLVDHVPADELRRLRRLCPAVELVQVIHVTGEDAVAEALAAAPQVDALLLDSGNPALAVKELGGTGRTHDWTLSRRIRDAVWPLPLFLAGGLHAGNVAAALAAVQPQGLDLCSRVRTEGKLDPRRLREFVAAARHMP
ncbi:MAG: phosphoribosylanthranilate isomerase [Rubrivivax sp.]|nr:phosphoribosylanthranilate isomerase [Rubrivivax sp.]